MAQEYQCVGGPDVVALLLTAPLWSVLEHLMGEASTSTGSRSQCPGFLMWLDGFWQLSMNMATGPGGLIEHVTAPEPRTAVRDRLLVSSSQTFSLVRTGAWLSDTDPGVSDMQLAQSVIHWCNQEMERDDWIITGTDESGWPVYSFFFIGHRYSISITDLIDLANPH